MLLEDYKKKYKKSDSEIARLVKVDTSLIRKIRNRQRRPSPDLAAKISAVTNGEVTILDLLFPEGLPSEASFEPPKTATA